MTAQTSPRPSRASSPSVSIALFELRKRLGMLSSYVYFLVFFACAAFALLAAGGAFSSIASGAGAEKVHANAPLLLSRSITSLTNIGVLMSAAVFGQAVHQDFESGTSHFFFTSPIPRSSYLTGRFLGALVFVLIVFASIGLGALVVSVLPVFVDRSLFGPVRIDALLWPYVAFVVPNAIFTGSIFFALGTLGRRMMPVYAGAVVLVLGYSIARILLSDMDERSLGALVDPFGGTALDLLTRYWTPSEKNTRLVPLTGLLLANRAIWVSAGLGALALTYARFRFAVETPRDRAIGATEPPPAAVPATSLPASTPRRGALELLRLLARTAWLELGETVKSPFFTVFLLAGGLFSLVIVEVEPKLFGSATWPVTSQVAELTTAGFSLFALIIITVYAGEIVWRERDLRLDGITDALPIPTWLLALGKLLALCLASGVVLSAIPVFGIAYQTFRGYHHYEIGLYLRWVYGVTFPAYVLLCVLAFAAQSVARHKYLGHFAMVAFFVFQGFQSKLGLEHGLLKYGELPTPTYSDMNGFGHYVKPFVFYVAYWGGAAILLAGLSLLFWPRGTDSSFRTRWRIARDRFGWGAGTTFAVGAALFAGMGCAIYYESDVLNRYQTSHEEEAQQAEYEKKYKHFEAEPQPKITDVKVDFDVYPETETLDVRGTYRIENKTSASIRSVVVTIPPEQKYRTLTVAGVDRPSLADTDVGLYTFDLPSPLDPGASASIVFDLRFHDEGFKSGGNRKDIVENGTFFNSFNLPHIGYERRVELPLDNDRKKYGLAPRDRLPDLHDEKARGSNLIASDADWVTFESTVSTSPDQIAVVPGYLVKEWTENGRRYFRYAMDSKILDFYSVVSARYAVKRDVWKNPLGAAGAPTPEVNLEVYYTPGHEYDVDEMIRGLKDTLTYDTAAFGPYQHRQARVLEFPRYRQFAQSFPNTIPWSESSGFISRVDPSKESDVDVPYYGAGHELSHQWWAHQVIGADRKSVV